MSTVYKTIKIFHEWQIKVKVPLFDAGDALKIMQICTRFSRWDREPVTDEDEEKFRSADYLAVGRTSLLGRQYVVQEFFKHEK